jgi:PKD domain-containing protein
MKKILNKKYCLVVTLLLLVSLVYLPSTGAFHIKESNINDPQLLNVLSPDLVYYPTYKDFGFVYEGNLYQTFFEIWNGGTGLLTWNLGIVDPWINVHPASGNSTGEHDKINVQINTTGLTIGSYSGLISISANDGGGTRYFSIYFEVVDNLPPNTPSKPSGPTSVVEGVQNTYTTITTDPENDDVKYGFDFNNDGIIEPDHWTSFKYSGEPCVVKITFIGTGTWYLRAKAEDVHGAQSGFSQPLIITVSGANDPPNTPNQPTGSSSGTVGISLSYSTSAIDPDDDMIKYGWDWNGDGTVDEWSSYISSGSTDTRSHIWTNPGTYHVRVIAEDSNGGQSAFSTPKIVEITVNQAPNKPTITGPHSGRVDRSLTYEGTGIDPEGDQIYYFFDWGDGSDSGWKGPYNSGQTASESHSWSKTGDFSIKVKTKDVYGEESIWSDPITVTMPKQKMIQTLLPMVYEKYPVIYQFLVKLQEI